MGVRTHLSRQLSRLQDARQQAAAAHLGAVTLELGGKDPVVVAPDADLERAAARIMLGDRKSVV